MRSVSPESFDGAVEFSHVDFSYVKGQPLIEDFSLDVKPGQRVAVLVQPEVERRP